jgi:two-component system phosphate regulon sensor histidine kinase PhoR
MWAALAIMLLAVLIVRHLGQRKKLARLERKHLRDLEDLQRHQQQTMHDANARQEVLFNSMLEGLLLLDRHHRIQLANRAFKNLFRVKAELRGKTIVEALRVHELAALVERVEIEGQVFDYDLKLPDLEERWLRINAAAVNNSAAERDGMILVFHDLSRIKQLERTREEFVANVSHELRTPLSLIKGYVETLLDGARQNPEVTERFLKIIERNAQRLDLLTGLTNDLPNLTALGDVHRLDQVIANLVDNAIKYGRTQGHVRVGGRITDAEKIEVFVNDDGPGIPAEALDRVFERFYRVDKARSRDQGGTGLGLSIVKHIVQSHGGEVWAESEMGKGTTFFFTLPIARAALEPAGEVPAV